MLLSSGLLRGCSFVQYSTPLPPCYPLPWTPLLTCRLALLSALLIRSAHAFPPPISAASTVVPTDSCASTHAVYITHPTCNRLCSLLHSLVRQTIYTYVLHSMSSLMDCFSVSLIHISIIPAGHSCSWRPMGLSVVLYGTSRSDGRGIAKHSSCG